MDPIDTVCRVDDRGESQGGFANYVFEEVDDMVDELRNINFGDKLAVFACLNAAGKPEADMLRHVALEEGRREEMAARRVVRLNLERCMNLMTLPPILGQLEHLANLNL